MKCNKCGLDFDGPNCPGCQNTTIFYGRTEPRESYGVNIEVHFATSANAPANLQDVATKKTYPVAFPICRIGREKSNELIVSGDDGVSRVHCLICAEEGYFFVADAGSTNGTLLNENELIEKTPLKDGDLLQIGKLTFKFLYDRHATASKDASESFRTFVNLLHKRMHSDSSQRGEAPLKPTREFKPKRR